MRLRMNGGDGDQSYCLHPIDLEVVERDWFKGDTPHGKAQLTKVLFGPHAGEYIALASRVLSSFEDQLSNHGFASVVVMVVANPGSDFEPDVKHLNAIGMSFVDLVA